MDAEQIRNLCADKRNELLNRYFGNLVYEAAHVMPEEIDESRYSLELPAKIGNEYYEFLENLLAQLSLSNQKKLADILDKKSFAMSLTTNDRQQLNEAYKDAKIITLWEKITKNNHEDVTFYKGLLKEYTTELLDWMQLDFIEDVQ